MKKSQFLLISLAVLVALGTWSICREQANAGPSKSAEIDAHAREVVLGPANHDEIQWSISLGKGTEPGKDNSHYLQRIASLKKVSVFVEFVNRSDKEFSNLLRLNMTPELREKALFVNLLANVEPYQQLLCFAFFIDTNEISTEEVRSQLLASELSAYWAEGLRDLDVEIGLGVVPNDDLLAKRGIIRKTVSLEGVPFRNEP